MLNYRNEMVESFKLEVGNVKTVELLLFQHKMCLLIEEY